MIKVIKILIMISIQVSVAAQEVNLDSLLNKETLEQKPGTEYTYGTFKSTTISNGHSVETLSKGVMELVVNHRFAPLFDPNLGGALNWFGLDNASVRIAFDYGISNDLMIGIGHSAFDKQYDAFVKYKILKQSEGLKNTPLTLDFMLSALSKHRTNKKVDTKFADGLSYAFQLLVARKFSEALSLQLMPTLVHYNKAYDPKDTTVFKPVVNPNDVISFGIGARQKITKRISINVEYYYNLPGSKIFLARDLPTKNSLCVGLDIETGGHVFQLIFTNGSGIAQRPFITETAENWSFKTVRFGFNVHRAFQMSKSKKKKAVSNEL